jgi:ketosteroid isomerase-like protein
MANPTNAQKVAEGFAQAWNNRDLTAFEELFHPEFQWHIAVTEPGVAELRPLQSNLLRGRNLPWEKAIYNKAETIAIFSSIFQATPQFSISPKSYIAQGDRVAVEVIGNARNETNVRRYNNLYCYIFEIRDGQIVLFREYQDTLLLFDVWVAE